VDLSRILKSAPRFCAHEWFWAGGFDADLLETGRRAVPPFCFVLGVRVTAYRPTSTASARAAVPTAGIWRTGNVAGALNSGAELALAVAALSVGVYIFATTLLMVVHSWTVVPYWDQWDNLILASDKTFSGIVPVGLFHWFFAQHNEHRIAVPRLIFAIDRFFFASTNRFNFT
jgi:hypothetical protein